MAKLICTLVCGAAEFGGTLHDATDGPVLAPFHGGKIYRAADVADEWFVKLAQRPLSADDHALIDRARAVGWEIVVRK
jgi:hypothetical protein